MAEGKAFDPKTLTDEQRKAIEAGVEEAKREGFAACSRQFVDMNGWKLSSTWNVDLNDYKIAGYYGLGALFGPVPYWSHTTPATYFDAEGRTLDGANRYTLIFDVNNLPPVSEFWEIPMYDQNERFRGQRDQPLRREQLYVQERRFVVKDDKLTFYIQKDKPADPDQLKNWLPASASTARPRRWWTEAMTCPRSCG